MKARIIEMIADIKENLELAEVITGETDLLNDVGLDSLQMINFILRVEEEFGIEVDFETFDYSHLSTVDTFCDFLNTRS